MPRHVVIAGGGIAGLETLLELRDLAEGRVRITLVSPDAEFEVKPLRTAEPFSVDHVRRYDLAELCAQRGADFIHDAVVSVAPESQTVNLAKTGPVSYDALVLALGARPRAPFPRALTFGADRDTGVLSGLLSDLERGFSHSAAFVVPPGVSWPLPLYELALMTAREVYSMGIDGIELEIVTPEPEPLALFGPSASDALMGVLRDAGIGFRGGVSVASRDEVAAERVVTIPLLDGMRLPGVPEDATGFIPVDDQGRVQGLRDVYAAGDGIDYPIKQGGLACQQADAIAEVLAAEAGAPVDPKPFRPVLRGKLLTGQGAQYLRRPLAGEGGKGMASDFELWFPPTKGSGHYLSQWLEYADAAERRAENEEHVDVDVPLPSRYELGQDALTLDPLGRPPLAWR
jgi:sulfide:quinone oxidoreductase